MNTCVCVVLVFSCGGLLFAQGKESRSGLDKRVPWTASRFVGSPSPPPPYQVEPAFLKRRFNRPVIITNAPGSERLFVVEQAGKIFSFENDRNGEETDLVIDLKKSRPQLSAIYGFTFHPQVEKNRFVYICYINGLNGPDGSRVSRFLLNKGNPPTIDAESEKIVITWMSGGHNGGCIKFGHDGYLYITTGDGSGPSPPDTKRGGQDVSNLLSSILRIDVDGEEAGKAYRVPSDNPLVDIKGARPEIWSYGFRNPWKMSFDSQTGDLWVGDVGWELWEMIYRVKKGGNYGWSIMEGRQVVLPEQEPGPTPILPPTIDHPHSEAASITGGFVYRGRRLKKLAGAYIYGDYQSGIIWGARLEGDKVSWHKELARTPLQLVGFGEDNDGELYLLDYLGGVHRLVKNPAKDNSKDFPRRLSDTGLFSSVAKHQPAAGVIPYSINAEHWADHTRAERWLAVPGAGRIQIDKKGNWQFPDGSVIAKTVSIDKLESSGNGSPGPGRTARLETQVLHRESGSWRPYTYVWNSQQTDADLESGDGFSRELRILDPQTPDGRREFTYRFAARRECTLCHNPWVEARTTIFGVQSASLLGMHARQLNRAHDFNGEKANQLATLSRIGLLDANAAELEKSASFVDPYDESADLDNRARSYLHVNCAHCHQFNAGGVATIALSKDTALKDTRMLNVRPSQGAFGISNASIITPGDPYGSVLFYRIAKLGGGRMPRMGAREVDERAVRLIHDWIAKMSGGKPELSKPVAADLTIIRQSKDAAERVAAVERLTSSTRGALALLHAVSQEGVARRTRRQVTSLTKGHAAAEVRDLFERFVPLSERTKRLGTIVNQTEILNLEFDIERGRQVFLNNSAAACKNCHRIGKHGQQLGPDLNDIGKKYPRDQLLLHLLSPSKFIEPKYVPYLLETSDGRVLSGLIEKQTDKEVVLKDAKNKVHRFAAADVELLVRQRKSLMPDLLLRDLTAQQVADLLAYLASLK